MSNGTHEVTARRGRHQAWIGATVFTAGFVGNGVIGGMITDRPLPMPDAAPAEVLAYFAAEPTASAVSGAAILVSALGLAMFVRAVGAIAPPDPRRTVAGAVAVAAWAVSGLLSLLLAVLGPIGPDGAVLLTRSLNFYTGGVTHVVALGAYVATLALLQPGSRMWGRGVRGFGWVAATCAILSIASIVLYPASILLPVGRLLCMAWTITAGIRLVRAPRGL
jgi:hypothetical protein